MSFKEKLKELHFEEDEILVNLIDKVKPLLKINSSSGEIKFTFPQHLLKDKQKIILYCLGAYFTFESNLRENSEVSNLELIDFIGKSKNTINPRLYELKKEKKLISKSKGLFRINPFDIIEDVENIVHTIKEKRQKDE